MTKNLATILSKISGARSRSSHQNKATECKATRLKPNRIQSEATRLVMMELFLFLFIITV